MPYKPNPYLMPLPLGSIVIKPGPRVFAHAAGSLEQYCRLAAAGIFGQDPLTLKKGHHVQHGDDSYYVACRKNPLAYKSDRLYATKGKYRGATHLILAWTPFARNSPVFFGGICTAPFHQRNQHQNYVERTSLIAVHDFIWRDTVTKIDTMKAGKGNTSIHLRKLTDMAEGEMFYYCNTSKRIVSKIFLHGAFNTGYSRSSSPAPST
jgi:hypothetical protein